jgi:hypothetical protein
MWRNIYIEAVAAFLAGLPALIPAVAEEQCAVIPEYQESSMETADETCSYTGDVYFPSPCKEIGEIAEGRPEFDLRDKDIPSETMSNVDYRFYQCHPELNGRRLTMGPDDYEYRKEWMDTFYARAVQPVELPLEEPDVPLPMVPGSRIPPGWPFKKVKELVENDTLEEARLKYFTEEYLPKFPDKPAKPGKETESLDSNSPDILEKDLDDFENVKNASSDKIEGLSSPEQEKRALDNKRATLEDTIASDTDQMSRQQKELIELRDQINNLNDQINQTEKTIGELQVRKQALAQEIKDQSSATATDRQKSATLRQELEQVEQSIAAEESRLASLQTQAATSTGDLETLVGAMSMVGSISGFGPAMSGGYLSGRSQVQKELLVYAGTSNVSGSQTPSDDGPNWEQPALAEVDRKLKAYKEMRGKEYGSSKEDQSVEGVRDKIRKWRQSQPPPRKTHRPSNIVTPDRP